MTKMIPPLPTSAVLMPTPKQKIGFSIESIVGNDTVAASPPQSAVGSNQQLGEQLHATNTANSTSGPGSPPQTPPAMPTNSNVTQLPGAAHLTMQLPLPLTPNAQPHHMHAHLPPHLTPAQQHALHQHLLLQHHHHQQQQQQLSPNGGAPMRQDIQDIIQRLHSSAAAAAVANLSAHSTSPYSPPPPSAQARHNVSPEEAPSALTQMMHFKRERSPLSSAAEEAQNPAQRQHMNPQQQQQQQQQHPQPPHTPPKSVSPPSSHPSSPPAMLPGSPAAISTPTQQTPPSHPTTPQYLKPPTALGAGPGAMILPGLPHAPGLVRPFPVVGPSGVPPPPPQQGMPDIKALPPYINAPPPELPPQHNPHLIAAAQFQMAAALQGHVLGGGLPPHASPFMAGPGMPRDSYPLYPWLLSRHGRIFPHRFPGNFLLQPFRKPKRIRTAFSPSQLLKLEHAFESNQYVVGAERKALAQSLNLSETQVKVWFQNRRTKHKRMQQEDDKGDGSHSDRSRNPASCDEDDDDELIDMEMDDCPSDDEHELDASH